jgi:hypothetical protein
MIRPRLGAIYRRAMQSRTITQLCRGGALAYGLENAKTHAATIKTTTTVKPRIAGQIWRRIGIIWFQYHFRPAPCGRR